MHGSNHGRFGDARDQAFIDRLSCRDAQRMAVETSFAKKVGGSQDSDDCFLALLRNDGELDLALLYVKNRVRDLPLRKNNLILLIFGYLSSIAYFGEKYLGIKQGLIPLLHGSHFFLSKLPFFLAQTGP